MESVLDIVSHDWHMTGTNQLPVNCTLNCAYPLPSQGPGLSAYLEDIESDEGDLMVDDDEKPLGTPPPEVAPPTPPATSGGLNSQHSKEQLLQKMETVDRDITATEEQISTLQKRQVGPLAVHLIGWLADDFCVPPGRVRGEHSFHSLHLHPLPSPPLSPPPLF